ncbi:tyrosine-type recombinase/integrase [Burkholderia cenocepacia]|uniref:tyrosine-type recombinase/integrase n=1 Tax=Burkholderia cenocepacia TaxID=95486 RepID=UPI001B92D351|nr:tyrosine-type recombinase/integrase [Burkholderia cenocepacia]MBR7996744.1 tyrosine-type recombinase/integrase [Burkholderia cenocepacia]
MASITPYKDGWRAQISVKPDPASKPIRDSQTFRTQREAKAWASAREHEIRKQAAQKPDERYTVRAMLERYDAEIIPTKRSSRSESLRLRAFLRNFPVLADKTLGEVATPDLAAWRDARLQGFIGIDGEQVPAVSVASALRDISWLRNAFSVARKEWQWTDANPFEGFRLPADPPPRDRRVSPYEVKLLCRQLGYRTGVPPQSLQQETALAFLIALRSAMRAGEILALGESTLDLSKRVARVPHKTQHLTGRPREVPLTRQAVRLLRTVSDRERCFSISSQSLDALFRKAKDRLAVAYPAIASLHFHDSRAEALTRMSRKVDVMTLARISGHADLRILQRTYYRESAADIAARLATV